jgi:hypothetical protein
MMVVVSMKVCKRAFDEDSKFKEKRTYVLFWQTDIVPVCQA